MAEGRMSVPRTLSVTTQDDTLIVMPLEDVGTLGEEILKPDLDALLEQLQQAGVRKVVVDLGKVSYFGTAMLKAMHAIWRRIREIGRAHV